MNRKVLSTLYFALPLLFTIVVGAIVVSLETPMNFLIFMIWATFIAFRSWKVHGTIMAIIITAAVMAPGKHMEFVRQRTVQLPSEKMTVAEFSEHCRCNRKHFPVSIRIPSKGPRAQEELKFSELQMPLQQFIQEFEEQTGCKHKFYGGCGNAYTILEGIAYNTLSFKPTAGSGLEWE